MEEVKRMLEERKNILLKLKKEKENALKKIPEGSLRISCCGNKVQYYHRRDAADTQGNYLPAKKRDVAMKLAQKDYDQKILKAIEREIYAIETYTRNLPAKSAEDVYGILHKERQKLIVPIKESDEQFVKQWEAVEYQGKWIDESIPEYYTAKQERVRSKSEVIIADMLNKEDIPYRYEFPLALRGIGTIYPDFTVLNVRTREVYYWEHLGMMDEETYAESALQKIWTYEQNDIFPGEKLLITHETRKNPLNQKQIQKLIMHYLK